MVEYPNDLAMAVIVAATSFAGMALVLYGLIWRSELAAHRKRGLAWLLGIAIFFGTAATALSVAFLGSKDANILLPLISAILLMLDTLVCSLVAILFLVRDTPREPITQTTPAIEPQERGLRPALGGIIAVLAIGISLLFQGIAWRGDSDIKTLGCWALILGSVFAVVGLILLFVLLRRPVRRQ